MASVGGYVKQYQVTVDPIKLQGYDIPISRVVRAIQRSNNDVGGRLVEMAETEYMVRGLGYFKSLADVENVPVGVSATARRCCIRDIAEVGLGPELRRGLAELDGEGEVVGGVDRHAARRERPDHHRAGQAEARGARRPACPRAWRSSPSTTARP